MVHDGGHLLVVAGAGSAKTATSACRVCGGTFHAVANRLLHQHGTAVGLRVGFTVLDWRRRAERCSPAATPSSPRGA